MKKHLLLLFLLCFSIISNGQEGSLDTSFNPSDIGFGNGDTADYEICTTVFQPDGKIIIGGDFTNYNTTSRNRIARLNTDGTLDTSFNPGTGVNSTIHTLLNQSDGKIIIGGNFITYNGTAINRIARLNIDGTLDTSFNPGTGANDAIRTTSLQPDGKIIIGGNFSTYNGTAINHIARLNADGTLDITFNPGLGANNPIYATAIQPDNKIIIGGYFTTYNGSTRNYIARLNPDGSLDTSFNTGTGSNDNINTISLQLDGKIIIGGVFTTYNGISRKYIARLNTDGTLDTSFDTAIAAYNYILTTKIQPDGKILISGTKIARLNSDGTLDISFNPGTGPNGTIYATSTQSDGKIIMGGLFFSYNGIARGNIVRLNPDGSLDMSFNTGTGADDVIWSTTIQPDDKIVIGGQFRNYNGSVRNYIARLNPDGTLDPSFNTGSGANGEIVTTSLDPNGKIIISGSFSQYNGVDRNRIARLNADGSLDTSFNPGTGINDYFNSISFQPDGKIIIGGQFTTYNGTSRKRIARLNNDGSLDTSFNPGTGTNNIIYATSIQPNGKIIIGGQFTTYNGTPMNRIARLNADGTIDTSFNPGLGTNNTIWVTGLQLDGKIIIGGAYTSYNGTAINRIARLNPDGGLDTSFTPGTGASDWIKTISLQADGKIIIGGSFTFYNGTARNHIARLGTNGTLDTSFNPGIGANNSIYGTPIQTDGKIIIGGIFTGYNGIGRNRIARLNNNVTLGIKSNTFETNEVIVRNNNTCLFVKSLNTPMKSVSIYDITGKKIYENKNVNSNELKIDALAATQQILIVKITDVTNKTLSKKILF